MTHATLDDKNRHDTVAAMTGKSGRGTARQTVRVNETLWQQFGEVAEAAGTDRSTLVREFIRWYVREPGARQPQRRQS